MKNYYFLVSLLMSLPISAQVINMDGGTTRAVVIGISDYADERIPNLQFAHRDAEAFADYLRSTAGGSLDGDHLKLLLNEQATTAQMDAAFGWLIEHSREGDAAIIYFSGHGDVDSKVMGQPGFLLTWNTPAESYRAGAYSLYYLQDVIRTLSLQNKSKVTVITDACHAGKLAGSSIGGAQYTNANLSQKFANEVKILSCQPNEYSIEGEQWGGGRGAFSYYLVDGLYGMADRDADGTVSVSDMDRYLEDHLTKEVAPQEQTPMIVGDKKERLAQVVPDILAQWKQSKSGQPMQFKGTESRGLEDETLATVDTSIRKLYLAFKRAVQEKVFLEPADSCANGYYEKLMAVAELKPLYGAMTRNFAAALQDDAQEEINGFLRSDPKVIAYWNRFKSYLIFPKHLEKSAELLGKEHYMYNDIKAKEYYFRARGIVIANNFSTLNWGTLEISTFRKYIDKGLEHDSIAPYLFFLKSYYFLAIRNSNLYPPKYSYQGAIQCLQKAIELAPAWSHAQLMLHNLKDEYNGADYHNFEKIKFLARISVEDMERQGVYDEQLGHKGNQYWWNGYLDKAENCFRTYLNQVLMSGDKELIASLGGGYGLYGQLGCVKIVQGDWKEAEKWWQIRDSLSENFTFYNWRCWVAFTRGQLEEANRLLDGDLRKRSKETYLAPGIIGDMMFLASIYDLVDYAMFYFKKTMEYYPEDAQLPYHLARLYLEQKNDYEKGVPLLERAVQLDSSHAYAHYHLAAAYAHLGKKDAALDYLEKALEKGYDDPEGIEQDTRWEGLRGVKRYKELVKLFSSEEDKK